MAAPIQPTDFFGLAGALGVSPTQGAGFQAPIVPSTSGLATRQGRVQSNRTAVNQRKLIHWLVPEGPIVQMYMNPQNIRYQYKKTITPQRTKGGYSIQYWGEELTSLAISGTTGTSGIEGINVLHDVYRNEQLAYDPYALYLASKNDLESRGAEISDLVTGNFGDFAEGLVSGAADLLPGANVQPPTLASLAFTVEMYWSGSVFRGYFEDFNITESVDNLGMFNYDFNFKVTQQRGMRLNFLPHHRSATAGPSSLDNPHSYGSMVAGVNPPPRVAQGSSQSNIQNSIDSIRENANKIF